jgi:hypothetical protein
MVVPPGNRRVLDLRRTCIVRRRVRHPRTPGRTAIVFALAAFPPPLKLRRDKPLSPASGFPVSWSQQVIYEISGLGLVGWPSMFGFLAKFGDPTRQTKRVEMLLII